MLSIHRTHPGTPLGWVLCFWGLIGCSGSTSTTTTTTTTDTAEAASLQSRFSVSCDEDGLDVTIFRGRDRSWWMGVAVTDPREEVWTGEDCYLGDTFNGSALLYCHPLDDVRTTLSFGADPLTLTPGAQTALPDSAICEGLTYYFFETTTEGCWVGGHKPDYYAGLCDNQVSLL